MELRPTFEPHRSITGRSSASDNVPMRSGSLARVASCFRVPDYVAEHREVGSRVRTQFALDVGEGGTEFERLGLKACMQMVSPAVAARGTPRETCDAWGSPWVRTRSMEVVAPWRRAGVED